jgi:hypothetical protein
MGDALYKADIGKIVSVASAPVSLVIATSIFLHMLTSRYEAIYDRLRDLTDEYRKGAKDDQRRTSLREQISLYARRIRVTQAASRWLSIAVISFLVTVAASAFNIVYPSSFAVRLTGMFTLAFGIFLLTLSVVFELYEDHLTQTTLRTELSEFPEIPND